MAPGACLGIDTATGRGSVALARDDGEPLLRLLEEKGGHARDLVPAIESVLAEARLGTSDLRGLGVASGPGSFTGVRVGMATAKGLAYALDIAVVGLSTLEALARAAAPLAPQGSAILAPVLPAGRGEVYSALFDLRGHEVARRTQDLAWRPEVLLASLPEEAILVDGEALTAVAGGSRERRSIESPPLAATIALWAAATIPPGTRFRPGGLTPNYVRPSDAEAARHHA
ncbi:MAG TPA: tRNA (adenosine(37)-N6)-threonylcarbamoyltransferase complex dimerization subunit type 1 TsaB [Candidatus Cryosericum sp.]|nr:tRNA (adenosine(37)-N6)-threonylcarbamoyltransferase complex dimerization subunit type 1 TsaB [Candidatus Cryosericum sp.]